MRADISFSRAKTGLTLMPTASSNACNRERSKGSVVATKSSRPSTFTGTIRASLKKSPIAGGSSMGRGPAGTSLSDISGISKWSRNTGNKSSSDKRPNSTTRRLRGACCSCCSLMTRSSSSPEMSRRSISRSEKLNCASMDNSSTDYLLVSGLTLP